MPQLPLYKMRIIIASSLQDCREINEFIYRGLTTLSKGSLNVSGNNDEDGKEPSDAEG